MSLILSAASSCAAHPSHPKSAYVMSFRSSWLLHTSQCHIVENFSHTDTFFIQTVLASQAEQMGASHKYDLTSDITHLIVGEYDTPKYRYVARERPDVKILTPNWIEAVRQLWIEAQPIDVCAMEREHTLPTFASLRICLTGFEDRELT